ncbi:MAG: LytTR family DNA-binding domain-containing protein [Paludibacter sp.]|nr:LytTR family DNA-binding domain-containing protein [Paludibacter sp.]
MQKRIKNYLNEPSTLFLSYTEGKIYFILLIPILGLSLNILQPMGLVNWHEFHKDLILNCYSLNLVGTYAVLYFVYSRLRPAYFCRESWTKGKQLHLLSIYIPLAAVSSWVFVAFHTQEVEFSLNSFLNIQVYNCIASLFIIPGFSYFISHKIKPVIEEKEEFTPENNETWESTELPSEMIINSIPLVTDNISYIESKGNDLHFWVLHNGGLIEIITRYTLKKLQSDLKEYVQFYRWQNSFIVNIHHVKDWDIVDGKMIIHPKYCTVEITVNRKRSEEIKELLRKNYIFRAK